MLGRRRLRERLDGVVARYVPGARPSATVEGALVRVEQLLEAQAEEAAVEAVSTARLLAALEAGTLGVVIADQAGEVVFRNQVATGFVEARHGDALVGSAMEEMIAEAVMGVADTRTLDLFGPPRRVVHLRSEPLRGADGALVIVEDISERHRLDAVRRDFVANISHELKTPVGALGILAETLVGEDDREVADRLASRMQHEAMRVGRTIEDLLQLSRIEASAAPENEIVSVAEVLTEAADRTRAAADLRSVSLVVAATHERLEIVGDRRQLASAVTNLCDNAVKYSDAGDTVRLGARRDDDWICIDVIDQGIGIPARDLERVFERFYRVDRARSRDTGGTGLGLAIVRHVVQNHEGEVNLSSREGKGSRFTLRFPDRRPAPSGKSRRIPTDRQENHP